MHKKIKLLILDDEQQSMNSVLSCALPCKDPVYEDQIIDIVEDLLEVKRCYTVTEAITWLQGGIHQNKPDIVFTDLKIKTETDLKINAYTYQGLYFIEWLRAKYGHDLPIKVHTRYEDVDEIELRLEAAKIGMSSFFGIATYLGPIQEDDIVKSNDKLRRNFPLFLQQAAATHLKRILITADKRANARNEVETALNKCLWHQQLQYLEGFTLNTLFAGWQGIRQEGLDAESYWLKQPKEIWRSLVSKPTSIEETKDPIQNRLEDFRKKPIYQQVRQQVEKEATEVLHEFVAKWRAFRPGDGYSEALKLNSEFLADANRNISAIESGMLDEAQEIQIMTRTFRLRLVIGGICKCRDHFGQAFREKIVDYAILACLRNSVKEVNQHARDSQPNAQVKKYLHCLGIGKARISSVEEQKLRLESLFEEEQRWLDSLHLSQKPSR